MIVAGDGFGVRINKPRRPGDRFSTTWRVVAPDRVGNPRGIGNFTHPGKPHKGRNRKVSCHLGRH